MRPVWNMALVPHPAATQGDRLMPAALAFLSYLVAFLCFLAAAFTAERLPRVNLIALGLAAWVLVPLVNAIDALD